MEQYNLQHKYLDVLINDFSLCFWRDCVEFDAIITDRKLVYCVIKKLFVFFSPLWYQRSN